MTVTVDLVAQAAPALDGDAEPELLGGANGAVEGDLRHHFGVSELSPRSAHLPSGVVGLAPDVFEVRDHGLLALPPL
jgi:hypothetical protein